jgi:hypothetical protein
VEEHRVDEQWPAPTIAHLFFFVSPSVNECLLDSCEGRVWSSRTSSGLPLVRNSRSSSVSFT